MFAVQDQNRMVLMFLKLFNNEITVLSFGIQQKRGAKLRDTKQDGMELVAKAHIFTKDNKFDDVCTFCNLHDDIVHHGGKFGSEPRQQGTVRLDDAARYVLSVIRRVLLQRVIRCVLLQRVIRRVLLQIKHRVKKRSSVKQECRHWRDQSPTRLFT
jgi:hypothetical protein